MQTDFDFPQDDTLTKSAGVTPSQTVGPFFHDALPYSSGPRAAGPDRAGVFRLTGQVLDGDGTPITDSMVEIWQADESGSFVAEPGIYDEVTGQGFRGFGRCATDFEGRYEFFTVKPGAVPWTASSRRRTSRCRSSPAGCCAGW